MKHHTLTELLAAIGMPEDAIRICGYGVRLNQGNDPDDSEDVPLYDDATAFWLALEWAKDKERYFRRKKTMESPASELTPERETLSWLKSCDYAKEYLKSLYWQRFRKRKLGDQKKLKGYNYCEMCGLRSYRSVSLYHVHHHDYSHRGEMDFELYDTNICCFACHQSFHQHRQVCHY